MAVGQAVTLFDLAVAGPEETTRPALILVSGRRMLAFLQAQAVLGAITATTAPARRSRCWRSQPCGGPSDLRSGTGPRAPRTRDPSRRPEIAEGLRNPTRTQERVDKSRFVRIRVGLEYRTAISPPCTPSPLRTGAWIGHSCVPTWPGQRDARCRFAPPRLGSSVRLDARRKTPRISHACCDALARVTSALATTSSRACTRRCARSPTARCAASMQVRRSSRRRSCTRRT